MHYAQRDVRVEIRMKCILDWTNKEWENAQQMLVIDAELQNIWEEVPVIL